MSTRYDKEKLAALLQTSGIRPTRQRLLLAAILFDGKHKHLTAEQVHKQAQKGRMRLSLATVYNNLHAFTRAGLLGEVCLDSSCSYFDTNRADHHHFLDESNGHLSDIPAKAIKIARLPKPPSGRKVCKCDVVIRLARAI